MGVRARERTGARHAEDEPGKRALPPRSLSHRRPENSGPTARAGRPSPWRLLALLPLWRRERSISVEESEKYILISGYPTLKRLIEKKKKKKLSPASSGIQGLSAQTWRDNGV